MADLVRDYISFREIAWCLEAARELVEKSRVEIELVIAGAVERPDGGARDTAPRANRAAIQDERRRLVGAPQRFEHRAPHVFGIAQDPRRELLRWIGGPRLARRRGVLV